MKFEVLRIHLIIHPNVLQLFTNKCPQFVTFLIVYASQTNNILNFFTDRLQEVCNLKQLPLLLYKNNNIHL